MGFSQKTLCPMNIYIYIYIYIYLFIYIYVYHYHWWWIIQNTWKSFISWENLWFSVDFSLSQSIEPTYKPWLHSIRFPGNRRRALWAASWTRWTKPIGASPGLTRRWPARCDGGWWVNFTRKTMEFRVI